MFYTSVENVVSRSRPG